MAPAWIRSQRRQCKLRILMRVSPVLVVLALQVPAAHFGWGWVRPRIVVAAGMILLIGGVFRTVDLTKALCILSEAIERYEFESAATESGLEEAGSAAYCAARV